MMCHKVALFGEAQRGEFQSLLFISCLPTLVDTLGHPPEGSYGLHFAVQTLLFRQDVIYIRVQEEGLSVRDYMHGLYLLRKADNIKTLSAICLPGIGNAEIIETATEICHHFRSILITTEGDFYDYLTSAPSKNF